MCGSWSELLCIFVVTGCNDKTTNTSGLFCLTRSLMWCFVSPCCPSQKIPQQTNENDCGVFVLEVPACFSRLWSFSHPIAHDLINVLQYSRCLALGKPLQFSQKDIPKIRKRIYKELCDCKLHEQGWRVSSSCTAGGLCELLRNWQCCECMCLSVLHQIQTGSHSLSDLWSVAVTVKIGSGSLSEAVLDLVDRALMKCLSKWTQSVTVRDCLGVTCFPLKYLYAILALFILIYLKFVCIKLPVISPI